MKGLINAIRFLTILPLGKGSGFDPKRMMFFFPITGLIIGMLLFVFDAFVCSFFSNSVTSLLDVIFLVVITGALHLDGLGDTADGLYGHRSREHALAIMKDSRIGVMGVVAIICCLAVKWCGISSIEDGRGILLLVIPAYARGTCLFGFKFLQYGRPEGGTGHGFFSGHMRIRVFAGLLIPAIIALNLSWKFLWLNMCFFIITGIILLYYKKKMGCITGDMLGAMIEITESMLFLLMVI